MSEYRNFNRCIICRAKQNLDDYSGEFEVTMLLNTLYLTVLHPIEKRANIGIKPKALSEWLHENAIVNSLENDFNHDDIVRMLRNGLAHLNIEINSAAREEKNISSVLISAKGIRPETAKPHCAYPCDEQKCISKGLILDENNNICIFTFSVNQLNTFTKFVIDAVLSTMPDDICVGCPYLHKEVDRCQP